KLLDSTVVDFNDTVQTDALGQFNVSLIVDSNWPSERIDTEIWVYFDPIFNSIDYVEPTELEFV
ncbi:MAG: hypothetical protein ACW99L_13560, partial [Promethearchaeota archaeon]